MTDPDGPPRVALITALVVAVAAVGAVLLVAARHQPVHGPVVIAAIPAPQATAPACRALTDALPQQLGDYRRAPVVQPTPDGTAAWVAGGDPVVLRCGLDRPVEFVVGSPIQAVDQVQWFRVRADGRSTWYVVDRPVYIALTLPPGSGPTPIQQLSELIGRTIDAVPINPAPAA